MQTMQGGHIEYTMMGILDILPMDIYVNDNSMANIFFLKEVSSYFCVNMDNKEDHAMLVHYIKDKAYRFKECGKVMYYLDVSNPEIIALTTERGNTNYSLLSTVNANMEYFTCAYIEGSDIARDLQHLPGWTSDQQLINALSKNLIINCPVILYDVRRAHAIYGTATAVLKGEMVRKNPKHVEFKQKNTIQAEILKHHPELPLHMDFCFINRHPYFTTITAKVKYRTIIRCRGRGRKDILKRLQAIVSRHTKRGLQVN